VATSDQRGVWRTWTSMLLLVVPNVEIPRQDYQQLDLAGRRGKATAAALAARRRKIQRMGAAGTYLVHRRPSAKYGVCACASEDLYGVHADQATSSGRTACVRPSRFPPTNLPTQTHSHPPDFDSVSWAAVSPASNTKSDVLLFSSNLLRGHPSSWLRDCASPQRSSRLINHR
jgi:hypothetical protein